MLSLNRETAGMTSRRKLWLSSIVVYALFVSWYTDFGGPLTEAEIRAETLPLAARCLSFFAMTRVANF